MSDVTAILRQIKQGDSEASESLLTAIYQELHRMAKSQMNRERRDHTLQPTALVNEAYLRLVGNANDHEWNNRGHFYSAAAEAMRRILVDHARSKKTAKRGGDAERVSLDHLIHTYSSVDLLELNEALDLLERHDGRKAALVKLRYFAGFTLREAATALGIAESTADADWAYAKAWLRIKLGEL